MSESEIMAAAMLAARNNDAEGVRRSLESVGDPSRRASLANQVVTQLASEDPKTAVAVALKLAGEFEHMTAFDVAAREVVRREPDFALRWATEMHPSVASRRLWHAMMDEWVRGSPRAAIDRIGALPAGSARDDMLVLAVGAWARRDPDATIAWLRDLPEEDLKPRLTSSVGFEIAQIRPDRAVDVAELLPEGRNRWLLYSTIAQTWVAVDSKAALAWVGKLPAGEARDAAYSGVDSGYGVPTRRRNPTAPGLRGGTRTRGSAAAIAAMAELNPPGFAAWLATQPPGLSREEALLEYVRQRAALEPAAVGPLIEAMSPGPTRDQAMGIYVDGLLLGSPSEAARWVRALPRSDRSDELIEKTARRWLLTNPDAALDWIEQSTLTPDRKERLRREAGR